LQLNVTMLARHMSSINDIAAKNLNQNRVFIPLLNSLALLGRKGILRSLAAIEEGTKMYVQLCLVLSILRSPFHTVLSGRSP
jgi:hypothetical protein